MKARLKNGRSYSDSADDNARMALQELLDASEQNKSDQYRQVMHRLGVLLGNTLLKKSDFSLGPKKILVASTAEDADFLSQGVIDVLSKKHSVKCAVFWNNHYSLSSSGDSVAPIVNSYFDEGYEDVDTVVIVKSIISGSCVVKTNLLDLFSKNENLLSSVNVLAPVMHADAKRKLAEDFPDEISSKFEFSYFALDSDRDESTNEVRPGIGGQVYKLLGFKDQPVKVGFIPDLVKKALSV